MEEVCGHATRHSRGSMPGSSALARESATVPTRSRRFKSFAKYLAHLLTQHKDKLPKLYLRVSCRTALWQSYFEDELRLLWDKDAFKKYELCPLTKSDVEEALVKFNTIAVIASVPESVLNVNVSEVVAAPPGARVKV